MPLLESSDEPLMDRIKNFRTLKDENIDKDTAEYIVKEFGHKPVIEERPSLETNKVKEKLEGDAKKKSGRCNVV